MIRQDIPKIKKTIKKFEKEEKVLYGIFKTLDYSDKKMNEVLFRQKEIEREREELEIVLALFGEDDSQGMISIEILPRQRLNSSYSFSKQRQRVLFGY